MVKTQITIHITGQKRAVKLVKRHLETDTIPSAFLFHGPQGCGKFTLALQLAETITQKRIHKDLNNILIIYPFNSKENLSLIETSSLPPSNINTIANPLIPVSIIKELKNKLSLSIEGTRVIIIKNIEYARNEALNAFLKTLEEPPKNTYFIITTDNLNSVIPTIRSRCTQIPFSFLSKDDIKTIHYSKTNETIKNDDPALSLASGSYTTFLQWKKTTINIQEEIQHIFSYNSLNKRIKASSDFFSTYGKSINTKHFFSLLMHIGKEKFTQGFFDAITLDDWIELIHETFKSANNNIPLEIILYTILIKTKNWRFN